MSEIDDVFARFRGDDRPPSADRREVRNIPQRGARASRTVDVLHVRSGATGRATGEPRQPSFGMRAAAWEDGFPARKAPQLPSAPPPPADAPAEPTIHVMPAWQPASTRAEGVTPAPETEPARTHRASPAARRQPGASPARRVADPFDANDDRANCLRCGYAVERARERRGLMTCAGCA